MLMIQYISGFVCTVRNNMWLEFKVSIYSVCTILYIHVVESTLKCQLQTGNCFSNNHQHYLVQVLCMQTSGPLALFCPCKQCKILQSLCPMPSARLIGFKAMRYEGNDGQILVTPLQPVSMSTMIMMHQPS